MGQLTSWAPRDRERQIPAGQHRQADPAVLALAPPSPQAPVLHSQHVVPEAALPLSLVEEVVEVAAEGDEDKAKGQEAKNACGGPGVGKVLPIPGVGAAVGRRA